MKQTLILMFIALISITTIVGTYTYYDNKPKNNLKQTRMYTITLDVYKEHKTMKVKHVFLYVLDIYKLMNSYKVDTNGKFVTQEMFKKLIEEFAVYEIKHKNYKVKLLSKVGWYNIYELVDHGIYDVYKVHKRY